MTNLTAPDMVKMRRVQSIAVSPDNTWIAVAVQRLDAKKSSRYLSDIYRVSIDGGEPTLLTRGEHNDHSPSFLHDGRLAFLSNRPTNLGDDEGHDKRSQVFAFPIHGGDPECLTDEPLGVSAFKAATEADVLCVRTSKLPGVDDEEQRATAKRRAEEGPSAIVYEDMPVRFWDHWLPESRPWLVTYRDGKRQGAEVELTTHASFEVAPNGEFAIANLSRLSSDRMDDQVCTRIDLSDGSLKELFQRDRNWLSPPVISPDSKWFVLTHHQRVDGGPSVAQMLIIDTSTGEQREVNPEFDGELAVEGWTPDGAELVASAAYRATRPLFRIDVQSHKLTRVTDASAGGTHSQVVVSGEQLIGIRSSLVEAPEVFSCPRAGGTPTRLTDLAGFPAPDNIIVEYHEVVSTDGTPVQYRVVRPDIEGELPSIMAIHGGPISDWGDVWHWRWNSLIMAAAGYVCVLPNPRGSVGFGREFVAGIWNNQWGAQCYEDLMAVADEVAARDDVDAERMMAMGGSFGGYMTNWIGTQTDRFKCLITHASIFDIRAFHGVTDRPAFWAFSFGVDPWTQRGDFDRYSPIEHMSNWKTPTLVIHGDLDYRVPVGEALALFEALRAHDVESRLLIYPDENHWILKPRNIESWYAQVLDWAGRYLA